MCSEGDLLILADRVQDFADLVLKEKFRGSGWSNPLVHFTAVLGINEHTQRLKQPVDYTSILAGLIYCSRLFLLQDCSDSDPEKDNPSPKGIERSLKYFHAYRQRWMTNGSYTPLSRMLGDLSYGLRLLKETGGSPKVYWEDPEEKMSLNYEGHTIAAAGLRSIIQQLVYESWELLWTKLLFTEDPNLWEDIDIAGHNESIMTGSSATNAAFLSLNDPQKIQAGAVFI